ncbi:hypothetical protein ACFL38_04975 [Candidatus Omnitrophota bacterium]
MTKKELRAFKESGLTEEELKMLMGGWTEEELKEMNGKGDILDLIEANKHNVNAKGKTWYMHLPKDSPLWDSWTISKLVLTKPTCQNP